MTSMVDRTDEVPDSAVSVCWRPTPALGYLAVVEICRQ